MQTGVRTRAANDLADIELHLILGSGCTLTAVLDYVADDGVSYAFERGERSRTVITARREGDTLHLNLARQQHGHKPLQLRVVGYDGASRAMIQTPDGCHTQALEPHAWQLSGTLLHAAMGAVFVV